MDYYFSDLRNRKTKIELVLLGLIILTFAVMITPCAKANDEYLQLSPSQGPAGTPVSLYGLGFKSGTVSITFGTTNIANTYTGMFGRVTSSFIVPRVSPGVYTVTATAPGDSVGTATFTVTLTAVTQTSSSASIGISPSQGSAGTVVTATGQGFSIGVSVGINFDGINKVTVSADSSGNIHATFAIPSTTAGLHTITATGSGGTYGTAYFTVTSSDSGTNGLIPTYKPTQTSTVAKSGFWSPLTIGLVVIAAAIAFIIPVTFLFRRRGKQETIFEEEKPIYNPKLPTPSQKPSVTTPYKQPDRYSHQFSMRPTEPVRYNQPSSYNQQMPSRSPLGTNYSQTTRHSQPSYATKTCKHCKQTVRADLNVCPHCYKRLS